MYYSQGITHVLFAITAILNNGKHDNLPVSLTFIDFKSAFGSISHNFILDILKYIKIPVPLFSYILKAYSKMSAAV